MQRLLILLFLLSPIALPAQAFQKVIFHLRSKNAADTLFAGQKIKVIALDTAGKATTFKGRLRDVRDDSLFLSKGNETHGFALAQVDEIQYRTISARQLIWGLLIAGIFLIFLVVLLFIPALTKGKPSLKLLEYGYYFGMGLLLLSPIIGIFSKRRIVKPAETRTIEIVTETLPPQNHS